MGSKEFEQSRIAEERDGLSLKKAIHEIEFLSRQSSLYSSMVILLTTINFTTFVVSALSLRLDFGYLLRNIVNFPVTIIFLSLFVFVSVTLVLSRFDGLASLGNAYFQEISDSFEWEETDPALRLQARIRLKQFILSTTLPFFKSGGNGPAFYIGLNAIFCTSSVLLIVLLVR